MRYRQLMELSKAQLAAHPSTSPNLRPARLFADGACWMATQMSALRGRPVPYSQRIPAAAYGMFKYTACLAAFIIAAVFLWRVHPFLLPVAVPFFYFAEVHFLFLFPLLIDDVERPLLQSMRAPYRMGLATTMLTVMCIAAYMIAGFFRKGDRLRGWYTGCIAVVIWYEYEVARHK